VSTDPHRSDRVGRRIGKRIALGVLVGPLIGGLLGLLLGSIAFDPWSPGMWAALVAGMAFGALGGFFAGMSALGPPAPDDDPLPRDESVDDPFVEESRPEGADPRR
jgi:MFS family permease